LSDAQQAFVKDLYKSLGVQGSGATSEQGAQGGALHDVAVEVRLAAAGLLRRLRSSNAPRGGNDRVAELLQSEQIQRLQAGQQEQQGVVGSHNSSGHQGPTSSHTSLAGLPAPAVVGARIAKLAAADGM
jgi:hypothetical protein